MIGAFDFRLDYFRNSLELLNSTSILIYTYFLPAGLSVFWSQASKRGFSLHDVVRLMCEEPAKLSRLSHRKGKIAIGMDADFVFWDPDQPIVVRETIKFKLDWGGTRSARFASQIRFSFSTLSQESLFEG